MPSQVTKIRVFAASPGDVDREREGLARVVERLNRTLGTTEALVLELVRWETHAWPGFGDDAQDVINQQVGPYDIFVGVMWKRLGTPSKRADSGTVEEFERAYTRWEQHGTPLLMFYFSRAPFFPSAEDTLQFQAVLEFKGLLERKGALYWEYDGPDAFDTAVEEHLYHQVRKLMALVESQRLNRSLEESGLGLAEITGENRSLADVGAADEIRQLLSSLLERVERLDAAESSRDQNVPAAAILEAAHGLMAARKWAQAAHYFDRYVEIDSTNWDATFSRAVAHANSRAGRAADVAALRSYNDAIALRPPDVDSNVIARLYSYRGAMMKRLGRFDEAEADLHLAESKATRTYEREDIRYNFACVYAMTGRRTEALEMVRSLQGTRFIGAIKANTDRYFAALANDPDFLALL
jgi:tetratricopeptide (TPR) repeat protein